jgi:cell division cycle 20-like protein 1, cofactor of APC complex
MSTPPPPSDRVRLDARLNGDQSNSRSSRHVARRSGVDAEVLSRALSRELSADRRESTPAASPSRKRQRINGDRYALYSHHLL